MSSDSPAQVLNPRTTAAAPEFVVAAQATLLHGDFGVRTYVSTYSHLALPFRAVHTVPAGWEGGLTLSDRSPCRSDRTRAATTVLRRLMAQYGTAWRASPVYRPGTADTTVPAV